MSEKPPNMAYRVAGTNFITPQSPTPPPRTHARGQNPFGAPLKLIPTGDLPHHCCKCPRKSPCKPLTLCTRLRCHLVVLRCKVVAKYRQWRTYRNSVDWPYSLADLSPSSHKDYDYDPMEEAQRLVAIHQERAAAYRAERTMREQGYSGEEWRVCREVIEWRRGMRKREERGRKGMVTVEER